MFIKKIFDRILLPNECTSFEQDYLTRLNKIAGGYFLLHLPIFVAIGFFNQTDAMAAAILTLLVLAGPFFAIRFLSSQRSISIIMGVTSMFMGALLVHLGQGPIQMEMHFYFFVNLALLAVFANPMVIIAAASTVAFHHVALWYLLPESVFNYDAPLWVVGVHALFVVLESAAACFIARGFFDNVVELEKTVARRTAELKSRNKDMRTLLNAVHEGFFTIDSSGLISNERSAIIERWLGPIQLNQSFEEYIAPHDAKFAEWFGFALNEVFNSILPIELTLDQLPHRFVAKGKTFECRYSLHETDQTSDNSVAVTIQDITVDVQREEIEKENREMMIIVDRFAANRNGFIEFHDECLRHIAEVRAYPDVEFELFTRQIHTLKGNAGLYGLFRVADACHKLEGSLLNGDQDLINESRAELLEMWESTEQRVHQVIGRHQQGIEISENQYSELLDLALDGANGKDLGLQLAYLKLSPLEPRLESIAAQAKEMARRLGKGNIDVRISHGNIRIDAMAWSDFWSAFVHVVRNAIDHGIETAENRAAIGKPISGQIEIDVNMDSNELSISLCDDGSGINWKKIRRKANQMGLPTQTKQQLIDAMFADGLSCADNLSDISGRGVGMRAIKAACINLDGSLDVESEPEVGTTVRFRFPLKAIAPEAFDMLEKYGVENAESPFCEKFFSRCDDPSSIEATYEIIA